MRFYKGIRELIITLSEMGISFLGAMLAIHTHSNLAIWYTCFSILFGIASLFELYEAIQDLNN